MTERAQQWIATHPIAVAVGNWLETPIVRMDAVLIAAVLVAVSFVRWLLAG